MITRDLIYLLAFDVRTKEAWKSSRMKQDFHAFFAELEQLCRAQSRFRLAKILVLSHIDSDHLLAGNANLRNTAK